MSGAIYLRGFIYLSQQGLSVARKKSDARDLPFLQVFIGVQRTANLLRVSRNVLALASLCPRYPRFQFGKLISHLCF